MNKARLLSIGALVILIVGILPVALFPVPVYAATHTEYANSDTYIIQNDATNYGADIGMAAGGLSGYLYIRSMVMFDVDWGVEIPVGATITAAQLRLYYYAYEGGDPVGSTVYALRMFETFSEVNADWWERTATYDWVVPGLGLNQDFTTAGMDTPTVPASFGWMYWNVLTQIQWAATNDAPVRIHILAYLTLKAATFAQKEYAGTTYDPRLVITYTTPTPTVTTGATSAITSTTATCAGTATCAATITRRGIQYGLTQTPTWDSYETGSFTSGSFSRNLAGLTTKTLYYYRAYAVSGGGTGYGAWSSFTTTGIPSVTTGDAGNILNATATCDATITSTGGLTVTKRGIQYGLTQTPTWDNNETGSFGTGLFSRDLTGLSANTTYWYRGYAVNTEGTGYGSWDSFQTLRDPMMVTEAASQVAYATARLNSLVEDDGGLPVTVRFGWGTTSQATIEAYDNYETVAGTYTTGQHPYLDIDTLDDDTLYYFRAEGTHAAGTDLGEELSFTTEAAFNEPTDFRAVPSATSVSLTWTKGLGTTKTLIRYGFTEPTTPTSGQLAYFGTSSSTIHEGLLSGTTYYYSAWGEAGTNYTDNYTTCMITTSLAGTGGSDLIAPDMPSRWLSAPDYTNLANLLFVYDAINASADALEMPRETFWMMLAIILSVALGIVGWLFSNGKMLIGAICLITGLAFGWTIQLIPFWIPLMTLILVVAVKMAHREVET